MKYQNTTHTINDFSNLDESLNISAINKMLVIALCITIITISAIVTVPNLKSMSVPSDFKNVGALISEKSSTFIKKIITPININNEQIGAKIKNNPISNYLDSLSINGIINNGNKSRVSINGKVFKLGNVISNEHNLKLVEILTQINTLVFKDVNGNLHNLRY